VIRWIPSTTSGRVEKLILRAGAQVQPDTVIMELTNPDLVQLVNNAELSYKSGLASLENQKVNMKTTRAQQAAAVSNAKSQYEVLVAKYDADKKLQDQGIVGEMVVKQDKAQADQAKNSWDLAQKQLDIATENEESQLAPQMATVNQAKAAWDQARRQLDDLRVKAGMKGVLQLISVQEGQQIGPGTNLCRVADPTTLKAEVRIAETQTKDLTIGQTASVDTRSGIVSGHVSRIDPAATGGTVGVDITLEGAMPAGARPDLSVDGTIQLQRLENILYVDHPAFGQEDATVGLFKVVPNSGETVVQPNQEAGHEAVLVTSVKFGRASVQSIEIKEGLKEGDRVVLSDMSQYDAYPRIKLGG
jgi:HlyD family secretion protein